ncbi:hypothetical protein [Pseudomonas aeruginosa]|uniref:hypothetical protein n=1 Tax=Pseudomonas aeruginosa TaxID=287 RepID=UPI0015FF5985|nr:hypothetical protein [Pseudomonas aeruginosa]MBX5809747.1 hypothetical protein [Pseudomonas aeruginosa]MDI2218202.1 hypothetical protein [Pseudomonas aeruginosa]MDU0789811.1 hypothetical protein [Pseudomonas aeruginosa]
MRDGAVMSLGLELGGPAWGRIKEVWMGRLVPERMTHFTLWAMWWLIIGSAGMWVLVGSVAFWVKEGWLPPDSAGWAQAIGAFFAVVVALALPYYQNRRQNNDRREDELRKRLEAINAVYALMDHVRELFIRLSKARSYNVGYLEAVRDGVKDSLGHELVQAAAMIREIPIVSMSNEMVHFVVHLREVATYGEYAGRVLENLLIRDSELPVLRERGLVNADLIKRWMDELDKLEVSIRGGGR